MAEQRRSLPFGNQKVFAVKVGGQTLGLRHGHAVTGQVFMQDKTVGLQLRPQQAQIHTLKGPVGPRRLDEEGMGLLLGPAGQIPRAKVPREVLLPGYLAHGIPAVANLAVRRHPVRGAGARIYFQCIGIRQASDHDGNAENCSKFDKIASRNINSHGFFLFGSRLRRRLQAS